MPPFLHFSLSLPSLPSVCVCVHVKILRVWKLGPCGSLNLVQTPLWTELSCQVSSDIIDQPASNCEPLTATLVLTKPGFSGWQRWIRSPERDVEVGMTGTQGVGGCSVYFSWSMLFYGEDAFCPASALLELQPTCLLLVLLFKVEPLGAPDCQHPPYPEKP